MGCQAIFTSKSVGCQARFIWSVRLCLPSSMIGEYVENGLKTAFLCCRRIELKKYLLGGSNLRCNVQEQLSGV